MHCDVKLPVLKGRFQNQVEKECSDEDWLHCFYLGSTKTTFEICKERIEIHSCDPRSFRWNDYFTKIDE